ncbi:MAG TPA: hypothetical protein VFW44_04155 [Bryobacteraceae bacterium]|nr:hypothetical protein [Bryobacteraceae bacterium]
MEVHFNPELQARLDSAASSTDTDPDDYVQQLVDRYLDHDVWFRQKVARSLEQLDRGQFLTHDEVGSRLKKFFHP